MTPHIEASQGDYAPSVLLPGDPARAVWIAQTYMEDARQVNGVRGELGFTGTYKGMPVSVQATGMGVPSVSIYANELITHFGVRTLMRVGTCGALSAALPLRSLVLSQSASTDSSVNRQAFTPFEFAPSPDFGLLRRAAEIAETLGTDWHVAPTVSSDIFYHWDIEARYALLRRHGAVAVDMETSAIYTIAAGLGARALSICTVVDSLVTGEETALSERQGLFAPMVEVALETLRTDRPIGTA